MGAVRWCWVGLCCAVLGCTPDNSGTDAGTTPDAAASSCGYNAFAGQQLSDATSGLQATLTTLTPQPAERGDNTWTLHITNASGAALTGAHVLLHPFMAAHGHGTTPADFDAVENPAGTYTVGPFNLFMPGDWTVTLRIQQTGQADVDIPFHACISG